MLDREITRKLRKSIRNFERELDKYNNNHCCSTISLKQCHMLLAIEDEESCTIGRISEVLNLDKSSVSRMVDTLVKSEHLERVIPDDNRRTTLISLSKKGQKFCDSVNESNDIYFSYVFKSFSTEEIEQFTKACENIAEKMVEHANCCGSKKFC